MDNTEELREKAIAGDAAAQDELGREIFLSMKTEGDLAEAVRLFSKSAEQGYIPAYINMVRMYLMGIILDSDGELMCDEINRLLTLALKAGNEEAQYFFDNIIFDWPVTNPYLSTFKLQGKTFALMFKKKQFAVFYKGGSLRLISPDAPDCFLARDVISKVEISKCKFFKKGTFAVYGNQGDLLFFAQYSKKMESSVNCAICILRINKVKVIEA